MSKQALQNIIDQNNFWAQHTDKALVIDIDSITRDQANTLYQSIGAGLSPENLHCDGEITRARAMPKYRNYMQAIKELKKRGFEAPVDCYEI